MSGDDRRKAKRVDPEAEAGLLGALKHEETWSATYLRSELADAHIEALKRYYGDPYGDEVEGRSSVRTRELFETIEWLRPDLRRVFTSGDRVAEFHGVRPEHDAYAEQAGDYIHHVFMVDNPGERVLDAFIFDGLLHRRGVIACEWKDAEFQPAQEVTGLNSEQAQQLLMAAEAGELSIEGQDVEQYPPDEAHPDGLFYDFKIRRRTEEAKAEVFAIAPEDFRIAARAVDLETARYVGDVVRMMAGEAKRIWPGNDEAIDSWKGSTTTFSVDDRRAERFRDVEGWDSSQLGEGKDGESAQVEILREFIRYDMDGDGFPELIRCYRISDTLLEFEEVDEHIYASWTPIPIPHRFYGLSIADIVSDLQRTKTVLLRGMLDSVYLSVAPRVIAKQGVNLDDLMVVAPGAVVRDDSPPGVVGVTPLVTPDLSASALSALQWVDRIAEMRSGVTRQAQGMDPDVLHDTAKGVELMQNAASVRKEEIARNLAEGLQAFFAKLYRLIVKHQDMARQVKIAGQWSQIDPRAWDAGLKCTVSVGLGTGAREKQLMMLSVLQGDQGLAVQTFGPNNPSVGPMELWNMVREKGRVLGMKSVDRFFKQPIDPQTGQPWVPPPQPSPDQMKIQAQMQEGQARLQLDAQKAQQDMQVKQFEVTAKAQADKAKAEMDAETTAQKSAMEADIARFEAEGRLQIAEREMQAKMAMQQQQMAFEAQMKQAQFEFEMQMAEREFALKERMAKKQAAQKSAKVNGSGVSSTQFGGEPG